jgi:hypothetical protein
MMDPTHRKTTRLQVRPGHSKSQWCSDSRCRSKELRRASLKSAGGFLSCIRPILQIAARRLCLLPTILCVITDSSVGNRCRMHALSSPHACTGFATCIHRVRHMHALSSPRPRLVEAFCSPIRMKFRVSECPSLIRFRPYQHPG